MAGMKTIKSAFVVAAPLSASFVSCGILSSHFEAKNEHKFQKAQKAQQKVRLNALYNNKVFRHPVFDVIKIILFYIKIFYF